jgi:hypothetical protein
MLKTQFLLANLEIEVYIHCPHTILFWGLSLSIAIPSWPCPILSEDSLFWALYFASTLGCRGACSPSLVLREIVVYTVERFSVIVGMHATGRRWKYGWLARQRLHLNQINSLFLFLSTVRVQGWYVGCPCTQHSEESELVGLMVDSVLPYPQPGLCREKNMSFWVGFLFSSYAKLVP